MADALATYLNEHLASSGAALRLLERLREQQRGQELGEFADELLVEIQQDHAALKSMIRRIDAKPSTVRMSLGWLTESASSQKLRLNEDPLGLFELLELLALGVLGKWSLWQALAVVAESQPALQDVDFNYLIKRANVQHRDIERHRLAIAVQALR